jgi:hypothetical protein
MLKSSQPSDWVDFDSRVTFDYEYFFLSRTVCFLQRQGA